ncbi:hypothetical protein JOC85_003349 [Bacillus mesophilus]|uniref:Uncharacterized protein n=1 Tax=Bacillus mesophilus TaxID=1808955 RepID=A0A6M0Q926_9BACI|nr:hypothetical protein [Bacillus mesophilus]MBM7662542.1 hypothetical protein [Bacillus mesophilus]NEY72835.1 hypothetical protein [Bacillus mesophilus]
MSFESKLKQILKDIKDENPDKRYQALSQLNDFKENDDVELEFSIFEKIAETAAYPFSTTGEDWDDPSLWLVNFMSDYQIPEVVDAIVQNYKGLSYEAKVRAFYFLCSFEEENNLLAIMDTLDQYAPTGEAVLIPEALREYPYWVKKIVEKHYPLISSEEYKHSMYFLILYGYENELIRDFHKAFILPNLLQHFSNLKEEYLAYNDSYSLKNVYFSWDESYLEIRYQMETFLMLLTYHYNNEIQKIFNEVMTWNDPTLATRALISTMQYGEAYDQQLLEKLTLNVETTSLVHSGLSRLRKEHLFLNGGEKQLVIARSNMFQHVRLSDDFEGVPMNVEIVDYLDMENDYGQPIRFYMAAIESVDQATYVGWVGAFPLEVPDCIEMWDGTYITEEEFNEEKINQYKEEFMARRKRLKESLQDELQYEEIYVFPKKWLTTYAVILGLWIFHFATDFETGILPVGITSAITAYAIQFTYKFLRDRKSYVRIVGTKLSVHTAKQTGEIELHQIKKMTLRKKGRKRIAEIYNRSNELVISFPQELFEYDGLADTIEEMTDHLKEQPYIEREY